MKRSQSITLLLLCLLAPAALVAQSPRVLYTWSGTGDLRGWISTGPTAGLLESTVDGELTIREAGSTGADYLVSDDFNRIAEGAPSEGGLDLTGLANLAFVLGHDGEEPVLMQFFVQATPQSTFVALGPDQEIAPGDLATYRAPLEGLSPEQIAYVRTVGFVVRAHPTSIDLVWTVQEVRSEGTPLRERDFATHEPGTADNGLQGALANFEVNAIEGHDPDQQNQSGLRHNTAEPPAGNTGSLQWTDLAGRGGAAITWGNGTSLFQGNTFWNRPADMSNYTQIEVRMAATSVIPDAVSAVGVQYFIQSGNFQFRVAGNIQQLPADGEYHDLVFPIAAIPSLFSVEQHGLNLQEHAGGDVVIDIDRISARRLEDFLDCNRNGVPDSGDLANARSRDCNLNGIPDECDIQRGSSSDCNRNAVPDECDIGGAAAERVLYTWEGTGDVRGWQRAFGNNLVSLANDLEGELTLLEEGEPGTFSGVSDGFNNIAEDSISAGGLDLLGAAALEFELGHSGIGEVMVQFYVQATPEFIYLALGPDQPIRPGVERYSAPLRDLSPSQLTYIRTVGFNIRDHLGEGNLVWTLREVKAVGTRLTQRDYATHDAGSSDDGLQGAVVAFHNAAVEGNDLGTNQTGLSHNTSNEPPGNSGSLRWKDLPGQEGGAIAWFNGTLWSTDSFNERPTDMAAYDEVLVRLAATNDDPDAVATVGVQYFLQTGNFQNYIAGEPQLLPVDGEFHELRFAIGDIPDRAYTDAHGIDLLDHPDGTIIVDVDRVRAFGPGVPEKDCNGNRLPDACDLAAGDRDQNGVPDECENRLPDFLRGDCNGDGGTGGVGDAIVMLTINFIGGIDFRCRAACDVNGDGQTGGVSDAIALLTRNFLGGVVVPPPYPDCGPSSLASDEVLGCETPPERCR